MRQGEDKQTSPTSQTDKPEKPDRQEPIVERKALRSETERQRIRPTDKQ